jgi:hypothetical protein
MALDVDGLLDKLGTGGQILAWGYADLLAKGALSALFQRIDPEGGREYIDRDISMWRDFTEERWEKLRRLTGKVDVNTIISQENVLASMKKANPQFYTILRFHPGGMEWLERQREELKRKLQP